MNPPELLQLEHSYSFVVSRRIDVVGQSVDKSYVERYTSAGRWDDAELAAKHAAHYFVLCAEQGVLVGVEVVSVNELPVLP